MPPNTAMRSMSSIPLLARRVGAERSILIARITCMVLDGERPLRLRQRRAEPGVRRFDQDRTHVDAAIGHHAAVVAYEQILIITFHHLWCDAFFVPIPPLP